MKRLLCCLVLLSLPAHACMGPLAIPFLLLFLALPLATFIWSIRASIRLKTPLRRGLGVFLTLVYCSGIFLWLSETHADFGAMVLVVLLGPRVPSLLLSLAPLPKKFAMREHLDS